ncbi:MAG TPA: NUDIX domain-containing protein [Thermomicrobiales bacterium]|nr:NUDIX domain-containing protein [Thermomicrobiales bacterium]
MTTDPQDELFDVLDAEGRPTGIAKPRRLVHRDGDWHGAIHIWIGAIVSGGPAVIYQRRSRTKDTWPGALDVAVGGHIRAGETLAETVREAEEELGLALTLDDLIPIGRRFADWSADGIIDREAQDVFALRCDQPLAAYRLHPEEVAAVIAIDIAAAESLFTGHVDAIPAVERPRDATEPRPITVRLPDIAGYGARYPLAALAALSAVLRGEIPQPFKIRTDDG